MTIAKRISRLRDLPRNELRRFLQHLTALSIAFVTTLLGLAASLDAFQTLFKPSTTTSPQVQELDRIRMALRELDKFVESQQKSIARTTATLRQLEQQRSELDKVVSINRDAAEALLRYQARSQARDAWFGHAMSFVLGVLSSLTATLLLTFRRRARFLRSRARVPSDIEGDA